MPKVKTRISKEKNFTYPQENFSSIHADLEEIYQKSLKAGKYAAALKAKEMQLKKNFQPLDHENLIGHLLDFSLSELNALLNTLEKKLAEHSV